MSPAAEKGTAALGVLEVANPFDLKAIGRIALSGWDAID